MTGDEQSADGTEHTIIHSCCDECPDADTISLLEHGQGSRQVAMLKDVVHTMAEEHAEETGHHVEVGVSHGSPDAAEGIARSMAESDAFSGVEADAFSPEVMTDGGLWTCDNCGRDVNPSVNARECPRCNEPREARTDGSGAIERREHTGGHETVVSKSCPGCGAPLTDQQSLADHIRSGDCDEWGDGE